MAWTLVSKAVVAALHNVSEDALEDEWSEWVEDLIADHMGYKYVGSTATVTAEKHNGDGTPLLFVKYPPIVSVTSLKIGSSSPSTLSSSSYKVNDHYVELVNDPLTELSTAISSSINTFPQGVHNIEITYVSGLDAVPAKIQFTAAEMIVEIAKFNQRGGADNSMYYHPQTDTRGQQQGVVTRRGLSATLQSIMELNLRKRIIPLG